MGRSQFIIEIDEFELQKILIRVFLFSGWRFLVSMCLRCMRVHSTSIIFQRSSHTWFAGYKIPATRNFPMFIRLRSEASEHRNCVHIEHMALKKKRAKAWDSVNYFNVLHQMINRLNILVR